MSLPEDLLHPLPGDNPSGENLRYAPVYDQVKEARRQEEAVTQGDWKRPIKEADYRLVTRLAAEALGKRSKDLQLAAWLCEASTYLQGFSGLTQGLDLLHGLVANFWDTVYPEPDEDGDLELRAAPLVWVGDYRDLDRAVRSIPITAGGLQWFNYTESRAVGYEADCGESDAKLAARNQAVEEGKLTAEAFDDDLKVTPKSALQTLMTEAGQALESLQRLDDVCAEKFADLAPTFRTLRTAIEDVHHVARMLLAKRRELDPDPEPEPGAEDAADDAEAEASPAYDTATDAGESPAPAAPAAPRSRKGVSAEPADHADAVARIFHAAHYLRREDPRDPTPYLMTRSLCWGELRARDYIDAELLEAPPTDVRQQLRRFAQECEWERVIETVEAAMSMPYGRAWLDLQRYAVRACGELGGDYDRVAAAVRSELKALLEAFPDLPDRTLNDDTPAANSETRTWLEELSPAAPAEPEPPPFMLPVEPVAEAPIPEAPDPFTVALDSARSGNIEKAMQILLREAAREQSGRGRFLRRLQLAELCLEAGKQTIAYATLVELANEIESRKLEDWESPEMTAKVLSMLYRCMDRLQMGEDEKMKVYTQICKLDPIQASRLSD